MRKCVSSGFGLYFFVQKYLTSQSLADQLQSQNNRLQHKLKQTNDDYRSRLVKYIEDIAVHISKLLC